MLMDDIKLPHCGVSEQGPESTHLGGQRTSSRNSSILLTSVLTSPLKVMKGGCVPGARFWRSAGFLKDTEWDIVIFCVFEN